MNLNDVKKDLKVKITRLGSTTGMFISQEYLGNRKKGATGTIVNWVAGHGGDVWWVKHDSGEVAAYCFDEFQPA